MSIPYHPQDQIRRTQFGIIYNWAQSLGKPPKSAYFMAINHVKKKYPIKKGEPLYPVTHTPHE